MRIPLWRNVWLSVWEKQNPAALRVTMTLYYNPIRVRRVLSKRGWALLLARYDWRDRGRPPAPELSTAAVVLRLTQELHRRSTHLDLLDAPHPLGPAPDGVVMNVRGEVLGLQAALGIALGGTVPGGDADRLAYEHYRVWQEERASEWSRCRCVSCERVLAGGV